jgi:hypothetical protein
MFHGQLPVLNGTIESLELPTLIPILVEAFGGVPPLDLDGGDSWVSAFTRLVVPESRCWMDNLNGLPPAGTDSRGTLANTDRATWCSEPATVVPLRCMDELEPKGIDSEQMFPLAGPAHIVRRSWPWTLCALASTAAVLLSVELFYTGDPAPVASSKIVNAAVLPLAPTPAAEPSQEIERAEVLNANFALLHATTAPPEAAPAVAKPVHVMPSSALPRAGGAPPRVVRIPLSDAGKSVQAQSAKTKAALAVKSASAGRIAAVKRGHARG